MDILRWLSQKRHIAKQTKIIKPQSAPISGHPFHLSARLPHTLSLASTLRSLSLSLSEFPLTRKLFIFTIYVAIVYIHANTQSTNDLLFVQPDIYIFMLRKNWGEKMRTETYSIPAQHVTWHTNHMAHEITFREKFYLCIRELRKSGSDWRRGGRDAKRDREKNGKSTITTKKKKKKKQKYLGDKFLSHVYQNNMYKQSPKCILHLAF